ncbi:hypothetical protein NSPZN2_30109 [Nitrospira defluvii]|uniref:Secreted protein n=1 Tax=Nitrospira defluvii TaxID=330214 RepID=A0ABM8RFF0_9BACT|nr:hypothetical protein NSPZN2_30109 [Nitrospira defluvii]
MDKFRSLPEFCLVASLAIFRHAGVYHQGELLGPYETGWPSTHVYEERRIHSEDRDGEAETTRTVERRRTS